MHHGLAREAVAHYIAGGDGFRHPFGNDVLGAGQGIGGGGHFAFNEAGGGSVGVGHAGGRHEHARQRFEAAVTRYRCTRAALGAEGQVHVLQRCGGFGLGDALAQFVGELALLVYGLKNGVAALFQAAEALDF